MPPSRLSPILTVVTLAVVLPEMLLKNAVTVIEPLATPVAIPFVGVALEIVAMAMLDDVHVASNVMSFVVRSLNVPVAMNCLSVVLGIMGFAGVIAIEDRVAADTVKVVLPETPLSEAVMVLLPVVRLVARPCVPVEFEMVATLEALDVQVTKFVISCVVASEYVPVAVNCCNVPLAMVGVFGVMVML